MTHHVELGEGAAREPVRLDIEFDAIVRLIYRAAAGCDERRILRLRRAEGSRVVAATLLALRPRNAVPGTATYAPRALLVIHQPGAINEIAPGFLSAAFNFTPAEARMAARLAAGLSVAEIAIEVQVSIATIRTQLSSTFDKTGTKRQADLVRLVLAVSAF